MRIHRIHIEHFRAVRQADLELGPGLNVLYGPNDLGKSTIGDALRSALLMRPTSSYADS